MFFDRIFSKEKGLLGLSEIERILVPWKSGLRPAWRKPKSGPALQDHDVVVEPEGPAEEPLPSIRSQHVVGERGESLGVGGHSVHPAAPAVSGRPLS